MDSVLRTGYKKLSDISINLNDQNLLSSYRQIDHILKVLNQHKDDSSFHRLVNMKHYMNNNHIMLSTNSKRVEDHLWKMIMHSSEDDPLILGDYVLSLRAIIANPDICKKTGLTLIEDGSARYISAKEFNKRILIPVLDALSDNDWK